ncbi:hypothetical protein P4661_27295 [Priestia megaterium]|uniref:hypothetical protein n=1 Tax=Priestia megaterium TaxID=1404 RepID=UPI002E223480|nr:hypothetical protein [Priestia megaterium]
MERPMPPPQAAGPYFKAPCMHRYKHIDTSKFKVTGEGMAYKLKVVDRFYCEKCLSPQVKESFFEIGEFR